MYDAYFTKRLLEALALADEATNAEERCTHLRASRYYRDLLKHPEKRRDVRHPVRISALLRHVGPRPRRVVLSDLSTCGCRLQLDRQVRPGTVVALEMEGLAPFDAYVIWQQGDQVGCKFLNRLHPALLDAALAVSPRIQ